MISRRVAQLKSLFAANLLDAFKPKIDFNIYTPVTEEPYQKTHAEYYVEPWVARGSAFSFRRILSIKICYKTIFIKARSH